MKYRSIVLSTLIVLVVFTTPIASFGQLSKLGDYYFANGHPKAKGLNFQLRPPLGFKQLEGDRPNIVQKWIKNRGDSDNVVIIMASVKNLSFLEKLAFRFNNLSGDLSDEEIAGFAPDNARNTKYFVLDNYPGIIFDYSQEIERLDVSADAHVKQIMVYVDGRLFSLVLFSFHENLIKEKANLFYWVANTVVFPDQYGN